MSVIDPEWVERRCFGRTKSKSAWRVRGEVCWGWGAVDPPPLPPLPLWASVPLAFTPFRLESFQVVVGGGGMNAGGAPGWSQGPDS